jgi:hypothetical protein
MRVFVRRCACRCVFVLCMFTWGEGAGDGRGSGRTEGERESESAPLSTPSLLPHFHTSTPGRTLRRGTSAAASCTQCPTRRCAAPRAAGQGAGFRVPLSKPAYRDHIRPCISGHKESCARAVLARCRRGAARGKAGNLLSYPKPLTPNPGRTCRRSALRSSRAIPSTRLTVNQCAQRTSVSIWKRMW